VSTTPRTCGRLAGKVALITGGGRGIGRAIALRYANEGAHCTIADMDGKTAALVADEVRARRVKAWSIAADVTESADIAAMVQGTVKELGSVDILVNNAGIIETRTKAEGVGSGWKYVGGLRQHPTCEGRGCQIPPGGSPLHRAPCHVV